jgi:hypothetical protein
LHAASTKAVPIRTTAVTFWNMTVLSSSQVEEETR